MIVDLFAGAGGVSQGLRMLGRTDVVGIENDRRAVAIARAAGHERILADVYGYDPRKLELLYGPIEGLHGSPPCGGLSSSGLGLGRDDLGRVVDLIDCLAEGDDDRADYLMHWQDLRSPLMAEPMRYLLALKPEWFTLEQVPEAVPVWEEYAAHLSGWGWFVDVGVVNAKWFGVPQDRERAILLAHRWQSVTVPAGPVVDEVPTSSVFGPGILGFPRRADRGERVTLGGIDYRARDFRPTTEVSFTVTGKADSWKFIREDPRTVRLPTMAELGQLQGFPPDYPWPDGPGERRDTALRIGNAVPPPMYAGLVRDVLTRPAATS